MTLAYNRIAYELDSLKTAPDNVEGLSKLVHFDYPESIAYTGSASVVQSGQKLGKGCAYFPDRDSRVTISNNTEMFNLNSLGNYELEAFVKFNDITADFEAQGYKFFDGHTFKRFQTNVTWENAKTACEALGGHITTSTSAEKNEFLIEFTWGQHTVSVIWLDCTYSAEGDTWTWETGEVWSYTNWEEGQPHSSTDYPHAALYPAGKWSDAPADDTSWYVCEWDYDMRIGNIFTLGDLTLAEKLVAEVTKLDATIAQQAEAAGLKFFGGHTFQYIDKSMTWADAKAYCETDTSHLATSTSAEKNAFLATVTTERAWIGGTDEETEGTWKWVTGEAWNYTNWGGENPNNADNAEHYLMINYNGEAGAWNDANATTTLGFIVEIDYDIREYTGYDSRLSLTSSTLQIDKTSQIALDYDAWYHILLRISNENISVFLNGEQIINSYIPVQATIEPEQVTLGGYIGYMDEFAFRRNAGTSAPEIPEHPYDSVIIQEGGSSQTERESTAPVTRAAWSAENLPEGLSLSENGILTGHPTTAGTYDVPFTVSTNWGTATKTLTILVQ